LLAFPSASTFIYNKWHLEMQAILFLVTVANTLTASGN